MKVDSVDYKLVRVVPEVYNMLFSKSSLFKIDDIVYYVTSTRVINNAVSENSPSVLYELTLSGIETIEVDIEPYNKQISIGNKIV